MRNNINTCVLLKDFIKIIFCNIYIKLTNLTYNVLLLYFVITQCFIIIINIKIISFNFVFVHFLYFLCFNLCLLLCFNFCYCSNVLLCFNFCYCSTVFILKDINLFKSFLRPYRKVLYSIENGIK